jgi:hypothetical protein
LGKGFRQTVKGFLSGLGKMARCEDETFFCWEFF